jgi:hypothetical protein
MKWGGVKQERIRVSGVTTSHCFVIEKPCFFDSIRFRWKWLNKQPRKFSPFGGNEKYTQQDHGEGNQPQSEAFTLTEAPER